MFYNQYNSEFLNELKKLNEELSKEEQSNNPDKNKLLKLKQQILMKGMAMSVGFKF